MVAITAIIAWWANFSMDGGDREAPFVIGWMGACIFIPLALICFQIAVFVSGKPSNPPEERTAPPEDPSDFRWNAHDDEL